jgi:hypothetical protein
LSEILLDAIRTRTDPDPVTLIVTPEPGGRFFMSLGG